VADHGRGPKLIEVAMPLAAIDAQAVREKSIRIGHPSTLHLWWSRKPLAAARAVLFAQLVDDPSARPDRFPTEADQEAERSRLLELVARLSAWDATADPELLDQARREVADSLGGAEVVAWDPFAGGGSIPLEAQRLGLPVVAGDLNPVAVLLERALLEIPRRWRGRGPVTDAARPGSAGDAPAAGGLAADLRVFGAQVLEAARRRLGPLYPPVTWAGGVHEVAAYLWVRTVTCGNPGCAATVPMLSNPWLRRGRGGDAWLEPRWDGAALRFTVVQDGTATVRTGRGAVFSCLACGTPTTADDVKGRARELGLGRALRCVVPDAGPRRPFLVVDEADVCPPAADAVAAAAGCGPEGLADLELELDPAVTNAPTYGVPTVAQLHLPRQLAALQVFADEVRAMTAPIERAARAAGWPAADAAGYARDLTVLLGLVLGRLSNRMSTACIWNAHRGLVEQTFIQNNAIAFPWDFAEANPLSGASGSWATQLELVARVLLRCDPAADAVVVRQDARRPPPELAGRSVVVSTDPPYFDYFLYSSLSDYFYVWLRRALRHVAPELFTEPATPREAEIVARRGDAGHGFLAGLTDAMTAIARTCSPELPITVYYAYRTTRVGGGLSAWEAFLGSLAASGLRVTATWPIRTERTEGVKTGRNSLASSIVVVCRIRDPHAPQAARQEFLARLRAQLPAAVTRLQAEGVSPVDLAQAAIGPGMAVYTGYSGVVGQDGRPMPVGEALDLVNRVLAQAYARLEPQLDPASAFCLDWLRRYGFGPGPAAAAGVVARARATTVAAVQHRGLLRADGRTVALRRPADPTPLTDPVPAWELVLRLGQELETHGTSAAAGLLAEHTDPVGAALCRELVYAAYRACQDGGRPAEARLFNALGTAFPTLLGPGPAGAPVAGGIHS
jgi:putative DNA methylase